MNEGFSIIQVIRLLLCLDLILCRLWTTQSNHLISLRDHKKYIKDDTRDTKCSTHSLHVQKLKASFVLFGNSHWILKRVILGITDLCDLCNQPYDRSCSYLQNCWWLQRAFVCISTLIVSSASTCFCARIWTCSVLQTLCNNLLDFKAQLCAGQRTLSKVLNDFSKINLRVCKWVVIWSDCIHWGLRQDDVMKV